jgi:hypothetical protein
MGCMGCFGDRYLVLAMVLALDIARTSAGPPSNHAAIAEMKSFGRTLVEPIRAYRFARFVLELPRNAVSAIGNPRALAHRA